MYMSVCERDREGQASLKKKHKFTPPPPDRELVFFCDDISADTSHVDVRMFALWAAIKRDWATAKHACSQS